MYAGRPVVSMLPEQAAELENLHTSHDHIVRLNQLHRRQSVGNEHLRVAQIHHEHHSGKTALDHYEDLVHEWHKQSGRPHEEIHHHLVRAVGKGVNPAEAMGFWGDLWGGIKRGLAHIGNKIIEDPEGAINSVAGLVNAVAKTSEVV